MPGKMDSEPVAKQVSSIQFPEDWDNGGDCPDLLDSNQEGGSDPSLPPALESTEPQVNGTTDGAEADDNKTLDETGLQRSNGSGGDGSTRVNKCTRFFFDDDDEDEDDDEENVGEGGAPHIDPWKVEDGARISCKCIICDHTTHGYEAADSMKAHIESNHNLPFETLKTAFKMDYLSFVQFVRWARELKQTDGLKETLQTILSNPPDAPPWLSEKYLLPPTTNSEGHEDYFLTLDYFAVEDNPETTEKSADIIPPVDELIARIKNLELNQRHMTEVFQRLILDKQDSKMGSCCSKSFWDDDSIDTYEFYPPYPAQRSVQPVQVKTTQAEREKELEKEREKEHDRKRKQRYKTYVDLRKFRLNPVQSGASVGGNCISNDDLYFDSYNEIGIHHEMIFDNHRTESYRLAIAERCEEIKGKLVMDIGCGTGILSMFAAQHEPRMVFAVDKSRIIYDAMSNCFENNFDTKIKFIHKDINVDELRKDMRDYADDEDDCKVDVMISEFMGYFLFFEGMTETFILARDKYLKPGGVLLPDKCSVELVPLGANGLYEKKVTCWDDAFGFKMPALKTRVLQESHIESVSSEEVIAEAVRVKHLDLTTCSKSDIFIDQTFEFEFNQDAEFCAVAGYFSVEFTGVNNQIVLSTSPSDPPTHWKQAVFFLPRPFKVASGEKMDGYISCRPHQDNPRWLVVVLEFNGIAQKYEFR